MACPRCGFEDPGPVECPRCGVVFAKLARPARPAPAPPTEAPPGPRGPRLSWLDVVLLTAFAASGAVIVSRWTREPPTRRAAAAVPARPAPRAWRARAPTGPPGPSGLPSTSSPDDAPPAVPLPADTWPDEPATGPALPGAPTAAPLPSEDATVFQSLFRAVGARAEIEPSHVEQAEALLGRHPEALHVGRLAEQVLELAASQASQRGRGVDAVRFRERATELRPTSLQAWRLLLESHEAGGAWREAEQTARRGLSTLPDESLLHLALARALSKQDRDEEAADVLRRRLMSRDDPAARMELARLEREIQSVTGLTRRTSAHFNVRFEGQEDAALGKALLRVLEEKYSMLARALECEPDQEIPVVLYPREAFRSHSQAPEWAGGYYSHADRRIRIGTRDLSPGFVPVDLERTLTHELTHAFVHARTRGAVPDDINEGLAQYLSGRRLGYRLDPVRAVVRDGRMKVDDFYDAALSFVEYLLGRYRQSTMNELLKHAGETRDVDEAFRRAYRQGYDETREEWLRQLR